ncbi:MAG: DUF2089 domain-containing protein [Clostridia bacterium]|nr:DUF2089 domain-containing protein [Clostridia bacterium]
MKYKAPGVCPVCGHGLSVSSLNCGYCSTKIEGEFALCKFCQLPDEQRDFIEVFIKCRGNIKDIEKELGISYPTVRNRLDAIIEALGYRVEKQVSPDWKSKKQEILNALDSGEISPEEATNQLKLLGNK